MNVVVVGIALVGSACVKSDTKRCGDFVCSEVSVCSPSGDRCVLPAQLDACANLSDGDGCTAPGIGGGVCDRTVCVAAGCGNGVVETGSDELCDDGNRESGDGCSADCRSKETCGDGVVDNNEHEQCDCGNDPANIPFGCVGINSMEQGATCRPGCVRSTCGDGVTDPQELCDDGNHIAGDGCRADCNGRWTKAVSGTFALLRAVHGTSATNVWAVGSNKVMHWDGVAWSAETLAGAMVGLSYTGVYAVGNDVYVVGNDSANLIFRVFRKQAGSWTNVSPIPVTQYTRWETIAGSGTDIWIGGWAPTGSPPSLALAHWNGSAFTDIGTFGYLGEVNSLAVLPDGTLYVADRDPVPNTYELRTDANWYTGINGTATTASLVTATMKTDVFTFAQGRAGHHHVNATSMLLPGSTELQYPAFAYSVTGPALVVGYEGTALFCTTTSCTVEDPGTTVDLYGAYMLDANHAFIVGNNGTILY
jgi:cysteine-rich repeat protein